MTRSVHQMVDIRTCQYGSAVTHGGSVTSMGDRAPILVAADRGEPAVSAGSAVRLAAYLGRAGEPRGYRPANAYSGRALLVAPPK